MKRPNKQKHAVVNVKVALKMDKYLAIAIVNMKKQDITNIVVKMNVNGILANNCSLRALVAQ